jgi:hypothetical protein
VNQYWRFGWSFTRRIRSFGHVTSSIRFQFCALGDLISGLSSVIYHYVTQFTAILHAEFLVSWNTCLCYFLLLERQPVSIYGTVFRKKKFYESLRCKPKLLKLRVIWVVSVFRYLDLEFRLCQLEKNIFISAPVCHAFYTVWHIHMHGCDLVRPAEI